ncbi:MAG: hypothetical protein IH865_12550 [Chloroflexi bacterium]|nr:hypothetical protein [Chloroflexota bacterium]
MTEPSLNGVWAKIGRAKMHRDSLETKINEGFGKDPAPPRFGLRFSQETGEHVLYVSRLGDFAEVMQECALLTSDLLNNLRSALDHLVFQLAVKCTKDNVQRPRAVQFPICDFRRRYNGNGFRDKTKTYLREVRGYWTRFEKLQPFARRHMDPNRALAILRDLNNPDKHQLPVAAFIVPKGYVVPMNNLSIEMLGALSKKDRGTQSAADALIMTLMFKRIVLGMELERVKLSSAMRGVEREEVGQLTPALSLGEQRSAVALCDRLITAVEDAVGLFEDAFQ